MLEVYKTLNGLEGLREDSFFKVLCKKNMSIQGNYLKRVKKDTLEFSFLNRVIDQWQILPEEVIKAISFNSFKNRIDTFFCVNFGGTNF